jgi:hypothetical protein
MPLFPRTDPDLRALIAYVVARAREREATLTQTKLVKLLYLIDVGRAAARRRPLTELEWRFFHYGPYALELPETLEAMEGHDLIVRGYHDAKLYVGAPGAPTGEDWPEPTRRLVDSIVSEWAGSDLPELLDHVYFETGPMIDAQRGELLDLTKSEPRGRQARLSPGEPDPVALARLRALAAERRDRLDDPDLAPTDGPFDAAWEEARAVEREIDGDPAAALIDAELFLDPSVLVPPAPHDE